ncbi:hypothetical protein BDV23DRAFT_180596 [Aspergillus alliaceus]|uniref:Rhodopsin domain-containing protein n=1 Tax=Petromyces alliaceus TaxID=209559 RepID=A0A5N7CHI8_PETAA|nr:hypothetical protein BDV23DRAFT_180596 [Aspergillus alliaceus]
MSSPFGEPPPDLDLSQSHTARNNAVVIAVYTLAAIAIILRVIARIRIQHATVAADDWLIVAALISVTANLVCTIIGGYYGLGKHVWVVPFDDAITVVRILFAYVLIYVVAIPIIKISIILFYRRIFGMNWAMWICVFLTLGYFVSCYIAFLVCCQPLSYYWTQYRDPNGGKCIFNLYPFYIGNAAANVATDAVILIVPIPLVWKLQMRTTQKILVSSIFLLGSFACVASIVRIYFMTFLSKSLDITWIMGDIFIWSSVEPCIGIVCACLPTLQPLLRSTLKRIVRSSNIDEQLGSTGKTGSVSRKQHKPPSGSRCLFRSLDDADARAREPHLRPEEEAALTTSSAHVELESLQEGPDFDPKSIRVKHDFQWSEEHQSIKIVSKRIL